MTLALQTGVLRCGVEVIEDLQHALLEVFFNHYFQFHKTIKRNADTE
jgi:hypothetical protein